MFDSDDSGQICVDDLHLAFERMGQEVKEEDILDMIKMHDLKMNGTIDYEEFKKMFYSKH